MISGDELFFLEIIAILGRKLHYHGMTSSNDDLFFRDHLETRTKIGLEYIYIPNFMTWFWHANCMNSLRGHRTPPVLTATDCIFVMCKMCKYPNQFCICEYMTGNMFYFEFNVTRFRFSRHSV